MTVRLSRPQMRNSCVVRNSFGEGTAPYPDMDWLVKNALADPTTGGNPVPLTSDAVKALYEECL